MGCDRRDIVPHEPCRLTESGVNQFPVKAHDHRLGIFFHHLKSGFGHDPCKARHTKHIHPFHFRHVPLQVVHRIIAGNIKILCADFDPEPVQAGDIFFRSVGGVVGQECVTDALPFQKIQERDRGREQLSPVVDRSIHIQKYMLDFQQTLLCLIHHLAP